MSGRGDKSGTGEDGHEGDPPDDLDEGAPDVGAGSARWMHEARRESLVASAAGGFFGGLVGKMLGLGNTTSAYWDARGDLRVTSGGGLTVTIDRRHASHIADVIRSRATSCWYHAGTRDSDLPALAGPDLDRHGDPETSWGEIIDHRDLERSASGDMAPAGFKGVALARRALEGEREAVDAFASRRRVLRAQSSDLESTSVLSTDDYAALTRLAAVLRPDLRRHVEDAIAIAEDDRIDGQARQDVRAQLAHVSSIASSVEGAIERAGHIALRRLARALQGRSSSP